MTFWKWLIFILIVCMDFLGYICDKGDKKLDVYGAIGFSAGIIIRAYMIYIIYTRWLIA